MVVTFFQRYADNRNLYLLDAVYDLAKLNPNSSLGQKTFVERACSQSEFASKLVPTLENQIMDYLG